MSCSRQAAILPKLMEAQFVPDAVTLKGNGMRVAQEWFESPELQSCILRFAVSSVIDINEPGQGAMIIGMATTLPTIGFNRGGRFRSLGAISVFRGLRRGIILSAGSKQHGERHGGDKFDHFGPFSWSGK